MSSNKRPGENLSDNTGRKASRTQETDSNTGEDVETGSTDSDIHYVGTNIDDVFIANKPLRPNEAKNELDDYDEPIILVLSKKARDNYWLHLKHFCNSDDKTVPISHDSAPISHDSATIGNSSEVNPVDLNVRTAKVLENGFHCLVENLDHIKAQFSDLELKNDLNSTADFDTFRELRKSLTNFFILGSKTSNMIKKFALGENDYLLSANLDFAPNRHNTDFISEIQRKMYNCLKACNAELYNETLEKFSAILTSTENLITDANKKLVAKAWRCVSLSNKDLKHSFRNQNRFRTYRNDQERERNYDSNTNYRNNLLSKCTTNQPKNTQRRR